VAKHRTWRHSCRNPSRTRYVRRVKRPFDVEEFVRRVAERGNVTREEARTGGAAVLTTLREAVTPGEFDGVASQLPSDYRMLIGPPS
jgi:uncharacterized protein (DUF2267 family)